VIDSAGKEDKSRGRIFVATLGFAFTDFFAGGSIVRAGRLTFDGLATGFERCPVFFCGLDSDRGFRGVGMRERLFRFTRFERECRAWGKRAPDYATLPLAESPSWLRASMIRRRDLLKGCGIAAGAAISSHAAPSRPNIITILLDDAGYGDYSCYGHPTIVTPNIDRMAREGVRFTQFLGSPLCTPSRGQLMTGRLGIRTGLTSNFFPWSEGGIPDSEITVAEMLNKAGYATMCIGKWHLGHLPRFLPTRHGFDDYFGIPYSNDMSKASNPRANWSDRTPPTPLIRGEKIIQQEPDQSLLTQRYTESAIEFIRGSRKRGSARPFFLYLAHSMPHQPIAASSRFRGTSAYGLYGDVIQEIDWSVGEILRVLSEQRLDRNTLVIFTSDNGPGNPGGRSAATRVRRGKAACVNLASRGGRAVSRLAWSRPRLAATWICFRPSSSLPGSRCRTIVYMTARI
jgi:arylsulfatase A-like enzyme